MLAHGHKMIDISLTPQSIWFGVAALCSLILAITHRKALLVAGRAIAKRFWKNVMAFPKNYATIVLIIIAVTSLSVATDTFFSAELNGPPPGMLGLIVGCIFLIIVLFYDWD